MPLVSTSTMADELENASEALLSFKNGLSTKIKEEPMDEEFNPASLGLHRIGDALPTKPLSEKPLLNRRGMPARIRKKNKLFFDDEASPDTTVVPKSMLKTPRIKSPVKKIKKPKVSAEPTPIKQEGGDRKLGQKIGMRLRNLLKLPKAHKWVCYEWFYSNIDSALFSGDNDFMVCLKESFPQLKTTMLTRVEWCKMRRMMGKPRRCSQAFFEEERKELDRKRSKIRQLQQRKPTDLNSCKDLPPEIPLQLVIGTKVTARLRTPQDGLFTGSVDAFDTSNDTYRITFERPGLGTHSIPDYEVLSNEPIETISVTSMVHALRPSLKPAESSLGSNEIKSETINERNGFPINILEDIVKLGKLLEIKKIKVNVLKDMNLEAERKKCHSQYISEDFVKKYALNVVELEHINCALDDLLKVVQNNCQERVPEMNIGSIMTPTYLRTQSLEEAKEIASQLNSTVKDPMLDLVVELTALMIQVKSLSESDRSSFEAEVLSTSMEVIKNKLTPANKCLFESNIEVHMRHIQSGLSGEMGAFSMISRP